MKEEGGSRHHKPPINRELAGFRRCGAVCGAASFAFAVVLARIFAAALPLAVVLAFAGMFACFRSRLVLSNQQYPGVGGCTDSGDAALGSGLCVSSVHSYRRADLQTQRRQRVYCGMVLHG